ncbi:MAG: metalloregulator ArsR/SmtB family transcription factor [Planctomycetota bacterium]
MVDKTILLDATFRALADPTRRSMLEALRGGERSIVELAEPFDMSLAGAAKHVQVLDQAGLITRRKEGRTQFCQLNAKRLREAHQWLDRYSQFWTARLDKLESLLSDERNQGKKKR